MLEEVWKMGTGIEVQAEYEIAVKLPQCRDLVAEQMMDIPTFWWTNGGGCSLGRKAAMPHFCSDCKFIVLLSLFKCGRFLIILHYYASARWLSTLIL